MPGRTPHEAVVSFLDPLQSALSCVASGKITTSPGGRHAVDVQHRWTLNDGEGVSLDGGHVLKAAMRYRIIREDRPSLGPLRVTTDGYMYEVEDSTGRERMSWHWHPETTGAHVAPHMHLAHGVISLEGAFLAREPLPTGRVTFESCIRWLVISMQITPLHSDWENRLTLAETPHKLYRTWNQDPAERERRPDAAG